MSRSMERIGPIFSPVNTFTPLFTVPPSHKFEVIEAFLGSDAGSGRQAGLLLATAAGGSQFVEFVAIEAGAVVHRSLFNGLVCFPGDTVSAIGTGAGWAGPGVMLGIIDVDYGDGI